jgi:hypothetical protein
VPMKVVTIATDLENPFLTRLLMPSCRDAGLDLIVLHSTKEQFTFADKRAALTAYLAEAADPDELTVFTDAYDTLFIRGKQHIERAYARFPQRVVFSCESNSWPIGVIGLALREDPPVGRFPYLNSGGFIGPAGDLLDLCTRYPEPPSERFTVLERLRAHGYDTTAQFHFSDQYHWTLVQLLEPDRIGVDHDAAIFEYYGPTGSHLVMQEPLYDVIEFREKGVEAGSYQRERARLLEQLQAPSGAAQLHFASTVTKAAFLHLLDEGLLPDWLASVTTNDTAAAR